MGQLISPINKFSLSKQDFLLPVERKGGKYSDETLIGKGLYNGNILICQDHTYSDQNLHFSCIKAKFFDILAQRYNHKPKMVNVNAAIKTSEKSILMFNRGRNVFAYASYWDFPAGLVPYESDLLERLTDRISTDAGINPEKLTINRTPSAVEIRDGFAGLYYFIDSKMSEKEITEQFKKNFPRKKSVFLTRKNVDVFFNSGRKIYPMRDLFSIFF